VKTGHDLMGLIKFAGRDEWRPHFEEVLGEHFDPALEEFELDFEGIGQALDDQWAMILSNRFQARPQYRVQHRPPCDAIDRCG